MSDQDIARELEHHLNHKTRARWIGVWLIEDFGRIACVGLDAIPRFGPTIGRDIGMVMAIELDLLLVTISGWSAVEFRLSKDMPALREMADLRALILTTARKPKDMASFDVLSIPKYEIAVSDLFRKRIRQLTAAWDAKEAAGSRTN
jgi:hypothetical protein